MRMHKVKPLQEWHERVAGYGFSASSAPASLMWNEGTVYECAQEQIEELWSVATDVYHRMVELTEREITGNQLSDWSLKPGHVQKLCRSWDGAGYFPTLFTRVDFDLAPDGAISLAGIKAEYPDLLVPSAVTQWDWLTQATPWASQFNEIPERLHAAFREYGWIGRCVHVGYSGEHLGEELSAEYIKALGLSAGVDARVVCFESIVYERERDCFLDDEGQLIEILVCTGPFSSFARMERDAVYEHPRICLVEPYWKQLWSEPTWLPFVRAKCNDARWAQEVRQVGQVRCGVWIVAGEAAGLIVYDRAGVCYPHFFDQVV